ncbi:MAG: STM3941 family protein [Flavobacteriaceae bacterium]|nr:STM3941 family protein [Flavobacteriaceae bacterium]
MKEKIIYKLNKQNLLITIGIILFFGVFGFLFFINPSFFVSVFIRSESLIKFMGAVICIMCVFLLVGYTNVFIKNYGLILSNDGITNNTNLTNVGLIHWAEITKIEVKELKKNKFILVFARDNTKYYMKFKNPFIKLNFLAYAKFYGTPFVIEPKNIVCSFEELERSILESYNRNKQN